MNNNPCFRCGRQRIVTNTYQKTIDNSVITYTEAVCPDPECQAALELQLRKEKEKRDQIALQKANQLEARLLSKRKEKQVLQD